MKKVFLSIVSKYNKGTLFCPFLLPIFQLPFPFQFQSTGLSWATAANNSMDQGGAQKSLAEIQAEEEGQERDRQERERKEKKARQKGTICFLGAMELVFALLKIEIFLPSFFCFETES